MLLFAISLQRAPLRFQSLAWARAIAYYSARDAGTMMSTWAYDASFGRWACITYHTYQAPTRNSQNNLLVLEVQVIQEFR